MFTQIALSDVENIIMSHLKINIKLNDFLFFKSKSENSLTIFCTKNEVQLEELLIYGNVESLGTPIIQIKKNHLHLLPSIIDFISNEYDSHHLKKEQQISISFGKAVKLQKPNSYCFIINDMGDKISFGKIEDNMFRPSIDLGWYLRQGT